MGQYSGGLPPAWQLVTGEFGGSGDNLGLADFDRVILDMLAPWDCVAAATARMADGSACGYVAARPSCRASGRGSFDESRPARPNLSPHSLAREFVPI